MGAATSPHPSIDLINMTNQGQAFDLQSQSPPTMTAGELDGFRRILFDEAGITLTQAKRQMVSARLSRRLRILNVSSYGSYLEYLSSPIGRQNELEHFVDVMTTNKTEFFREINHFTILADLLTTEPWALRAHILDPIRLWSAGCSTGEEPYSLAMLLYEHYGSGNPFSILATDICKAALERAERGVYTHEIVRPVPEALAKKYLMRGREKQHGFWRVVPEIRDRVQFEWLNLMESQFEVEKDHHAIWCRNVMIYFDTPTKVDLVKRLCRHLVPGGYLFIGHSESLNGLTDELVQVVPAVYRKATRRPS